MKEIRLENEKKLVAQVIDKWLEGWSGKDVEVITRHVANDFVAHLPNRSSINGLEALKDYVLEYYNKRPFGPVLHVESQIDVSTSGDLAYEVGRHDHVMVEESGSHTVRPWNHLIVLKKTDGKWKVTAISETNISPSK